MCNGARPLHARKSAKSKGASPVESTREKGQRDDVAQQCEAKRLRTNAENMQKRLSLKRLAKRFFSLIGKALLWLLMLPVGS